MFEAEINVGRLIECIEPITAISDEAVLNIVADGWKVKVVEPANVAMISHPLSLIRVRRYSNRTETFFRAIKLRRFYDIRKVELR